MRIFQLKKKCNKAQPSHSNHLPPPEKLDDIEEIEEDDASMNEEIVNKVGDSDEHNQDPLNNSVEIDHVDNSADESGVKNDSQNQFNDDRTLFLSKYEVLSFLLFSHYQALQATFSTFFFS